MKFLRQDTFDLAQLTPYPGNARRGDVEAIMAALVEFGQYRGIVVREHGNGSADLKTIIAGNHTCAAISELTQLTAEQLTARYGGTPERDARALAWAGQPAVVRADVIECDGPEARKINAADNRLAELGGYDDAALLAQLQAMGGDFAGTGWTGADLTALSEPVPPPEHFPEFDDDLPTSYRCPQCSYEWSGKPR